MKNAVLFAATLFIAASAVALPSHAAQGAEPEAAATEPMKAKPAKPSRHSHKHERHSENLKAPRHHHRAAA